MRTEGVIACGVVDLNSGELLAHDSREPELRSRRARRLTAARRVFSAAGGECGASEELMVTQGTRIELLRAGLPAPTRFGLVLMLDRRLANVLIRFRNLQAEKHPL